MKIIEKSISILELYFAIAAIILFSEAILPMLNADGLNGNDLTVDSANDGNIVAQVVFSLIYIGTFFLIVMNRSLLQVFKNEIWLTLLFVLVIISVSWSHFPLITLRRTAALLGTSLFGYYMASRYSLNTVLMLFCRAFLIVAVLSILTAIALPNYGIMHGEHEGNWRGIYIHKNILGRTMCLYATAAFSLFRITKMRVYIFHILLAVALIGLSQSISALLVTFCLLSFGYLLKIAKLPLQTLVFLFVFLLIGFVAAGYYVINNYVAILQMFGKDATLTGRTALWRELMIMVGRQPILGYGYGGFWTGLGPCAVVWKVIGWEAPHSHDGYLNVLVDLGYVGLGLYLVIYFRNFLIYLIRFVVKRETDYMWGILFFIFLLIYNISECTILRTNSIYWIAFLFTVSYYRRKSKEVKYVVAEV